LRQFSDRLDPGKSIPQELASSNDSYILTPKVLPLRYLANRFSNLPPKHILLVVGPQGSGKTALLKNTFYSDNVDVSNNYISFHREFTPEELQACILSKLDTYRKK
jgi:Cdc6-like AAA superfamily ATPase